MEDTMEKQGVEKPVEVKRRVVDLYFCGLSFAEIGDQSGVSKQTAYNIVKRFVATESILPGKRKSNQSATKKLTDNVIDYVEYYKTLRPSIYRWEIRQKLLEDGVCTAATLPGRSSITYAVQICLNMTRKKLSSMLTESCTDENIKRQLDFLEEVSNYEPHRLHWFDEASVIKTTGNRRYGHATFGSRATFTANLLVGVSDIDHVDVIEGPSNGYELLHFFHEAVAEVNEMGNPCLAPNDVVIMDNCPFHDARHVEQNLLDLLNHQGVRLFFQPPYNPQFNVCELCFRHLKSELIIISTTL
ncbi:uncharacterized protein LOC102806961 [Saccoglossus kowalevskii]|uniref:Paired box protein Pax-7-like n=1 Tax=Saccoglossus kowalevskii TaxID=10224 RepID=A0ABM0MJI6_SACKO|nr:PREDICTED: paired box protein Pax-7-like [Saccoglossus kowalevskii]